MTYIIWNKVSVALKCNITWKHIIIGLVETNESAKIINICVGIIAYTVYSQWVICSLSNVSYNTLNLKEVIIAKLRLHCCVMKGTRQYKHLGERLSNVINNFI